MTHTPGPWKVYHDNGSFGSGGCWGVETDEPSPHGRTIAVMAQGNYENAPNARANARLIAAAPELLDALKGMLEWARRVKEKNPGQEIVNALNAVARAEGQQVTA